MEIGGEEGCKLGEQKKRRRGGSVMRSEQLETEGTCEEGGGSGGVGGVGS